MRFLCHVLDKQKWKKALSISLFDLNVRSVWKTFFFESCIDNIHSFSTNTKCVDKNSAHLIIIAKYARSFTTSFSTCTTNASSGRAWLWSQAVELGLWVYLLVHNLHAVSWVLLSFAWLSTLHPFVPLKCLTNGRRLCASRPWTNIKLRISCLLTRLADRFVTAQFPLKVTNTSSAVISVSIE